MLRHQKFSCLGDRNTSFLFLVGGSPGRHQEVPAVAKVAAGTQKCRGENYGGHLLFIYKLLPHHVRLTPLMGFWLSCLKDRIWPGKTTHGFLEPWLWLLWVSGSLPVTRIFAFSRSERGLSHERDQSGSRGYRYLCLKRWVITSESKFLSLSG